ncbi:class I SAM-dependent methyltransferase [Arthrobacter monumenti]
MIDQPRMVALYDEFNAGTWDTDFYAGFIGERPHRVADVGCGTGSFAVRLARAGHNVVGVDPSAEMLHFARSRPGADLVRWIDGDATSLPDEAFDSAIMSGHAFQNLLSDEQILETLTVVRKRLVPGGRFMFESRNPARKAWTNWHSADGDPDVQQTSAGRIEVTWKLLDVDSELVTFGTSTRFDSDGAEIAEQCTLRFIAPSRLSGLLTEAGYDNVQWYGNWDGAPFEPASSPEIIVVAA